MRFGFLGRKIASEDGNVFLAIFGAVAMVGILGASVMTFMKGPLATSVKLTRMNSAENQMAIGAQVAVMATASQANGGDCETAPDGYVEPIAWRSATTEPIPTGGGLVPLTLGISKKDPWGTEYGYCVWNHGPTTSGAGCGANMLAGTNSRIYPVVSLVSAGPDKAFTTTCRSFATADVNADGDLLDATDLQLISKAADTDDDVITTFSYEEATGASGGLWSIKSGSPDTAIINKKIETSGVASFQGGVLLPDKSFVTCDATTAGVMAKSATGIEICDGAGNWTSIGGSTGALGTTATCASAADTGNLRYNTVNSQPEFCNGTAWLPFTINTPGVNLVITPNNSSTMNVDGANNQNTTLCTNVSGMTCGAPLIFTITNQGTLTSATLLNRIQLVQSVNGSTTTFSSATLTNASNTSNFVIETNTCTTTLAVNATCTVTLLPKASGNITYTAVLRVNQDNIPVATLSGTSTNFGCVVGRVAPGGIYVGCGITDPDGTYDLVLNPRGCNGVVTNPVCSGSSDPGGIQRTYGQQGVNLPSVGFYTTQSWGARQHQNIMAYAAMTSVTLPAVQYCQDFLYQGQSDWFLPSYREWEYVRAAQNAGTIPIDNNWYMLSDQSWDSGAGNRIVMWNPGSGYNSWSWDRNTNAYVRCLRREGLPLPAAQTDADPDNVTIIPQVVFTSGGAANSNTVTIGGILETVSASITGPVGATITRNGVPTGLSSVTGLKNGDTLRFSMAGPTAIGTKENATITIGPDSYSWWVGYADSTRVAKVFVTSSVYYAGSVAGLTGGDNICNSLAGSSTYGLSGSWRAILSNSSTDAANRIPWNWGDLQTVTGTTVATSHGNLFSGSFNAPINIDQNGVARSYNVWTGSASSGGKFYPGATTPQYWAYDWTSTSCCSASPAVYGLSTSIGNAFYQGTHNSDNQNALYCIENIDSAVDTIPADIRPAYIVQAALSSRQMTPVTKIAGMSNGATTTLSISAPSGNPGFTINGGAEVTSGTVRNGDDIIFYLDAPATASTSIMMTITSSAPATTLGYWRVWSGWDGIGTGIKRVFVTSTDPSGSGFGGVTGADSHCQSRASAAALGGTWRAIISSTNELAWAVNRVGYNWNELRLVDGTTVVAYAPNLWSGLLNPIIKTEFGATRGSTRILSGTASNGSAYSSVADLSNLFNWTGATCSATYMQGNSSALTAAISQGYWLCQSDGALFCIEQ
jgi:hypothetical protein